MNIEETIKQLESLVPKILKACKELSEEEEIKLWSRDFIQEVASICIPDQNIEFKDKNQPQEPQVQQEEFKELSDEQKIHELIRQFYNEIVVQIKAKVNQNIKEESQNFDFMKSIKF